MAQQQINYGAFPDDANADAIRTAFLKVDQNFTDLYNNGVAGVTSVNSGNGVQARTIGSNVYLSANINRVNFASGANSFTYSIGGAPALPTATYTSGQDTVTISPAANFNLTNVYLQTGLYLQDGTAVISNVSGTATFTGDGSGLRNIPLKPAAGGAINQVQFVGTDVSGNLIVVGNSNFNYVPASNTLTVTGVLPVAINGSTGGISAAGGILAANVSVNNNTITNNLVVNNSATFSGTVTFSQPITSGGQSIISNTAQSTTPASGALVVSGGAGIGGNINVGGNANIAGNVSIGGTTTVTGTITGGNLSTTGNISATGNSSINGNSVVGGTLTVGNTVTIAGQTNINNNIAVTGNSTVTGNSSIGGNATITGNITVSGTSNITGNATFGGEIFVSPTVAQVNQVLFINGSSAIDGNSRFTWNQSLSTLTLTGNDYTGANTAVLQISGGAEMSGNLYVGGKIFVANISGNNLSANDLSVSGNLSVTGNMTAKGATNLIQYNNSGNLDGAVGFSYNVGTGAVTVANTFTGGNLITGGNANVGGNLTVTGNATVNGAQLYVSAGTANAAYFSGQANTANIIARNLTSTRIVFTDTNSQLVDSANLTWSGTQFTVTGNTSTTGSATIQSNITVTGNAAITGNTTIGSGSLTVSAGNVSIDTGVLFVKSNISTEGTLTVSGTGNSTIAGNLFGSLQIGAVGNLGTQANLNVGASAFITANANVTGNLNANNASITNTVQLANITAQGAEIAVRSPANLRSNTTFGSTVLIESTNTLTVRDITTGGSATTGTITGNWSLTGKFQATYADLAEYYASDADYLAGTVLEFGGNREVTIASNETTRLAGVVTTEPAYVLNSNISAEHPACIALVGRVPVRVTGYVHKGDMLVSAGNGVAKACAQPLLGQVIGKSLEDWASHSEQETGIITVAISRH